MSNRDRLWSAWQYAEKLAKRYGTQPSETLGGASWVDEAKRRLDELKAEEARLLQPDSKLVW